MSYQQPPGWGPQGQPPQWGPQGQQPWQPPPPPPPTGPSKGKVALAVIGTIAALCVVGMIGAARGRGTSGATGSTTGSMAPAQQRQYIAESCSQLSNMFSNNTRMTDMQREQLWQSYDDKWVRWTASVNLLEHAAFGGYRMQFKCSPNSLVLDGHATFDDSQQAALMRYQQGSQITFEGRLTDWGQFTGITIDDATVVGQ